MQVFVGDGSDGNITCGGRDTDDVDCNSDTLRDIHISAGGGSDVGDGNDHSDITAGGCGTGDGGCNTDGLTDGGGGGDDKNDKSDVSDSGCAGSVCCKDGLPDWNEVPVADS